MHSLCFRSYLIQKLKVLVKKKFTFFIWYQWKNNWENVSSETDMRGFSRVKMYVQVYRNTIVHLWLYSGFTNPSQTVFGYVQTPATESTLTHKAQIIFSHSHANFHFRWLYSTVWPCRVQLWRRAALQQYQVEKDKTHQSAVKKGSEWT